MIQWIQFYCYMNMKILTKELTLLYNYGNKLKTLEGDTVFLSSRLISCSLITEDSKDIIICLILLNLLY